MGPKLKRKKLTECLSNLAVITKMYLLRNKEAKGNLSLIEQAAQKM